MHPLHHAALTAAYDHTRMCLSCGDDVLPARWSLGYRTCLPCGERAARTVKHCIVPLHKSNYFVCTDRDLLVGINNKGGLVK